MCQSHHGFYDRFVRAFLHDVHDEGSVDLQHVKRQVLQVSERGVARAEVIDRELDAEVLQLGEEGSSRVHIVDQGCFRDLEHQRLCGEPRGFECRSNDRDDLRLSELACG